MPRPEPFPESGEPFERFLKRWLSWSDEYDSYVQKSKAKLPIQKSGYVHKPRYLENPSYFPFIPSSEGRNDNYSNKWDSEDVAEGEDAMDHLDRDADDYFERDDDGLDPYEGTSNEGCD